MKPRSFSRRGTSTKLARKWHEASCSGGTARAGWMLNSSSWGDEKEKVASGLGRPSFCARAFRLAFCALRSVALVSLRKTRSNSSL